MLLGGRWRESGPPPFVHLLSEHGGLSTSSLLGRLMSHSNMRSIIAAPTGGMEATLDTMLHLVSFSTIRPVAERTLSVLDRRLHDEELFRLELIKAGGFNAFMACVLRWREDDDMSLRALCLLDMLAVQVDSLEPEQIANLVDVADQCLQKPGLAFTYQIIDLLSKAVEADSVCDCIVERCNLQLLSKCIDLNYQQAHDPDLQKAALGIIMAVASKAERRAQMPLWFMRVIETGLTRHVSESTITIWLQFLGLMVKESNLMRVQQLDLVIYVIKILKTLAEQQLVQEPDFSKANKQQVLKFLEKCRSYRPPSASVPGKAEIASKQDENRSKMPRALSARRIKCDEHIEPNHEKAVDSSSASPSDRPAFDRRDLNVIKNAAIKLLSSAAPEIAAQAAIADKPQSKAEQVSVKTTRKASAKPVSKPRKATPPIKLPQQKPAPKLANNPPEVIQPPTAARASQQAAAPERPVAEIATPKAPQRMTAAEKAKRDWDIFVEKVTQALEMLGSDQFFLRVDAAASLRKLLSRKDIPADLCEKISVALAPCFQDADQIIVHACCCLTSMASKADCRHRMASLGATGHVVGCLSSYNMTVIEHALKAISFFAADGSFTELLLSHNLLKGLSVVLNNNTEIVSRNARMVLGHLQRLGGDRVQVEIDMLLKGNPWDVIYAQWNRDR